MGGTLRIHFTDRDFRHVQLASAPDPMWETVLGLHVLGDGAANLPAELRRWRSRARGIALGEDVRGARRLLLDLAPPDATYFPDFLTPVEGAEGMDAGVEALRATPRRRLAHDLDFAERRRGALPAWTRRLAAGEREAVDALVSAVETFHRHLIRPGWSTVEAAVDRDRHRRLHALEAGVDWLLGSLAPFTWHGAVLSSPYPLDLDVHLRGRGVRFIPSFFCHSMPVAIVDPRLPPVVVYPIGHVAEESPKGLRSLQHLLGANRARVLHALWSSSTTSGLAARLGISESSVSGHVKVLREAGLVTSARAGHHVLHALTTSGEVLLDSASRR